MSRPSELYGRPWSEREYIIVLHFYFLHKNKPRHLGSEHVSELAYLLGRTPGAVVMRLENYASLDPEVERRGLKNVGPIGERVFDEWSPKRDALKSCANVLLREARSAAQPTLFHPEPVKLPKAFSKYELLDLIGEGGFGVVYSCVNTDDQKTYAIKIIRTDMIRDPMVLGRFRREIKALKSRTHANVIQIREDNLDVQKDFPAFVMDYAQSTLSRLVQHHAEKVPRSTARPLLPKAEAIAILENVFAAGRNGSLSSSVLTKRPI